MARTSVPECESSPTCTTPSILPLAAAILVPPVSIGERERTHHLINTHQRGSRACSLLSIWSQSISLSWCISVPHCSLLTVVLGCDIHGLRDHVIESLGMLEKMSDSIATMVPLQVLADIDNSRNPMLLTKERLERAATENQFMNGKTLPASPVQNQSVRKPLRR